jgi:hypothetical protein
MSAIEYELPEGPELKLDKDLHPLEQKAIVKHISNSIHHTPEFQSKPWVKQQPLTDAEIRRRLKIRIQELKK